MILGLEKAASSHVHEYFICTVKLDRRMTRVKQKGMPKLIYTSRIIMTETAASWVYYLRHLSITNKANKALNFVLIRDIQIK